MFTDYADGRQEINNDLRSLNVIDFDLFPIIGF